MRDGGSWLEGRGKGWSINVKVGGDGRHRGGLDGLQLGLESV